MEKHSFITRLISLLAVQEGIIPASTIGLNIKQSSSSIKNQLKVENFAIHKKGESHAKS